MDPITLKKAKDYTDEQIRSVDNNAAAEYAMQQGDYAKAEAGKVQPKLDVVESVVSSANQTIESMEQATLEANQSADYALEQGDYAKNQGSLVEGKLEEADQAISTANQSATNADEKAEIAQQQASLVDGKLIEMEAALSSIGNSTSNAEQAAGQAESQAQYAKEQGDYAKQQGDMIQDALDGNLVTSVNGKSGEVQLTAADVGAETVEGSQGKANQAEQNAKEYTNQQLENFSTVTTWDELEDKPTEFTPASHGHSIGEVEGLQDELTKLENKLGDLTELQTEEKENVVQAINEVRQALAAHQADDLQHGRFMMNGVKYQGGWRVDNGDLKYVYEEVE